MIENVFTKTNRPEKVAFLDGALLLIDKPKEWTSFDVVNKIRHTIKHTLGITGRTKVKVGHSGTLDPMATGLLLICTGKYTKLINDLTGQDKSYTGTLKLGATTPSYDAESEEDNTYPTEYIKEEDLYEATKAFHGDLDQIPPIYSAIKKKGQKLYKLARRGETIELDPRPVTIHSFSLTSIEMPYVSFESSVSKGTYIRSLAHDFGKEVGSGAYLTELRRTLVGEYSIEDAFQLEDCVEWIRSAAYRSENT